MKHILKFLVKSGLGPAILKSVGSAVAATIGAKIAADVYDSAKKTVKQERSLENVRG